MEWKGRDKRQFIRASFPCKVTIYTPQRRVLNIYTQDLSEGGMRIICEEKLEISSLVGLRVYLDKETAVDCQGRIVWVLEKPDSLIETSFLYDTGVEFYDMTEEDKRVIGDRIKLLADNIKASRIKGED
jgi:c-di-GMP-binding flagellar brake protein YcgR